MQKTNSIQKAIDIFTKHTGLLRTSEALHCGIQPRTLYNMRQQKIIKELARGLFRLSNLDFLSHQDLIIIAKQLPKGVICLLSALDFHGITSHVPHYVYVAYQQNWHQPKIKYPPVKIFRFAENTFNTGIEKHIIDGVNVQIYSPEKTIADCFKFRNKIGIDVAIEALKLYWQKTNRPNIHMIMKYAKICRVDKIMKPYLEGLTT
jgi:predicted transcriptional regulator of viral defense system